MFKLTQEEFKIFKRRYEPEVFTKAMMENWIEDMAEDMSKAEINELDEATTKQVNDFKTELSSFQKITVIGKGLDPLIKGLSYDEYYVRPKQVEFSEIDSIIKSEDGKEETTKTTVGKYMNTELNRKMDRVGVEFEKKN